MKTAIGGLSLVGLWMFSAPASGTTWSGLSTTLPGTSIAERPELAGSVIASQRFSIPLNGDPSSSMRITLDNWVVREISTGDLDFYYRVNNPNDLRVNVQDLRISGFDTGPALDVDRRTDLGGLTASAFAARGDEAVPRVYLGTLARGAGAWSLGPQVSLAPFFIHTNATAFESTGQIDILPTRVSDTAFVPATGVGAVPEPSTLALLPLAVGALAFRRRTL